MKSLLDLQQFFDPEGEAEKLGISSSFWPLFGKVWPMSKILARVMLEEPIENARVLEIGCGLALPSLVVKKRGGDITACDYHPLTETFLKENTALNNLDDIEYKLGDWNSLSKELGCYDLIIGSDVLYERHYAALLSSFINFHASPGARVIIVDPGRGTHRIFAREMQALGYDHTWSDLSEFSESETREKGVVLRFTRHTEASKLK